MTELEDRIQAARDKLDAAREELRTLTSEQRKVEAEEYAKQTLDNMSPEQQAAIISVASIQGANTVGTPQ